MMITFVLELDKVFVGMPMIVFGVYCFASGVLCWIYMPETLGKPVYNTLKEWERGTT
jgi:hypothetical protein